MPLGIKKSHLMHRPMVREYIVTEEKSLGNLGPNLPRGKGLAFDSLRLPLALRY